jgi:hypothetical protein
MKIKYLKAFGTGEEERAREYALKVNGIVKRKSCITGVRTAGMPVAVDTYYVYPREKCKYCNKKAEAEQEFCSKNCKDEYDSSVAIVQIKGDIMKKMREMAMGDIEREKKFLEGLYTCLKLDFEDRRAK